MKKQKTNNKKYQAVLLCAVLLVVFFGVLQATGIKGADTSQINLIVDVQTAISVTCSSPGAFSNLIAGSPVTVSTTCTTSTNALAGYDLKVKRDDGDTTLDLASDDTKNITDKTAWTSATPNAALWSGTGLGFRVKQTGTTATYNTTWWGSDDTAGNAKFAGLPSTYEIIMDHDSYSATSTATAVEFKVDVPATQAAGTYDGTVTFQTVAKP